MKLMEKIAKKGREKNERVFSRLSGTQNSDEHSAELA